MKSARDKSSSIINLRLSTRSIKEPDHKLVIKEATGTNMYKSDTANAELVRSRIIKLRAMKYTQAPKFEIPTPIRSKAGYFQAVRFIVGRSLLVVNNQFFI